MADFVAFFVRRHLELEGGDQERYKGERCKVAGWVEKAMARALPRACLYPKRGRCDCAEMFFEYAPPFFRE